MCNYALDVDRRAVRFELGRAWIPIICVKLRLPVRGEEFSVDIWSAGRQGQRSIIDSAEDKLRNEHNVQDAVVVSEGKTNGIPAVRVRWDVEMRVG